MRNMTCIYYTDMLCDPELLALPKFSIGDRVRVVKIKGTPENYLDDVDAVVGQVLPIADIILWETNDPDRPYFVTYEVEISHLTDPGCDDCGSEWLCLEEDEIEPA